MPPPKKLSRATAVEVWPGVYRLDTPFDRRLNTWIKEGDGDRKRYGFDFDREYHHKKAWYIPEERIQGFVEFCESIGWNCPTIRQLKGVEAIMVPPEVPLTSWQSRAVRRVLFHQRSLLIQHITGAGKSRIVIEVDNALRLANPLSKTLIVCPKMVLKTWETEQLPKWLRDPETSSVWALTAGRKLELKEGRGEDAKTRLRDQPEILLVSWDSLHRIPPEWSFDLIAYDELHLGIRGKTKRTNEARILRARNGHAVALGLTATPTSTSLTDLHSQLNILRPEAQGSFGNWWRRYFVEVQAYEQYTKPGPLKPSMVDELTESLDKICDYVSHEDVGDALPPVEWKELVIGVPPNGPSIGPPESLTAWRSEQQSTAKQRVAAFTGAPSPIKGPTAIICYHRVVASLLAEKLRLSPQYAVAHVDGSIPVKERHERLKDADIAIVTMKSVTEGIDLRRYTSVYVLESYPVPRYLTQVLGRFIRLFAEDPVTVTFCRLRGSSDDIVVNKLLQRMADQSTIIKQGKVEAGLGKLLSLDESSEDFLAELRAAAGSWQDDDQEDWESDDWDD